MNVGWVERSETHHLAARREVDGFRCALPILRVQLLQERILLSWLPTLRRQLELRKLESRRDRAADQRPVAAAFRRLPGARRYERLRLFAARDITAERDRLLRAAVLRNPQGQRRAGIMVPHLDGVDAVPMRALAARQQPLARLTGREQEVCLRILSGLSSEAIAASLGIGLHSALTYRKRAYDKLGISSQNELFAIALRLTASVRQLN